MAELADHAVLLRRRNAPTLRLSRADHDEDRVAAIDVLARLLRHVVVRSPEAIGAVLDEALPWASFLPPGDHRRFVEELSRMLVASAAIESFASVAQLLREWRATATIHADPQLARRLKRPIVAAGPVVRRPRG